MTEQDKTEKSGNRLSPKERLKYIGFEVFPSQPRDLFKTDAEKDRFVDAVRQKRSRGELIRDECTLLEERVSFSERLILTITSVLIFAALFLPWYSAYTEVVEEPSPQTVAAVVDSLTPADSTLAEDSLGSALATEEVTSEGGGIGEAEAEVEGTLSGAGDTAVAVAAVEESTVPQEEILHGLVARQQVHREWVRLSGIGGLISIGSLGGYVFSSGLILILTALILIVYTLLCIGLPALMLYTAYGTKGSGDELALKLKKVLKLNWLPVILFVLALAISFVGASYGFSTEGMYTSIGSAYGIAALINSLSWGVFISLCGFILLAAKGLEI